VLEPLETVEIEQIDAVESHVVFPSMPIKWNGFYVSVGRHQ
jgi:hypothetical protein